MIKIGILVKKKMEEKLRRAGSRLHAGRGGKNYLPNRRIWAKNGGEMWGVKGCVLSIIIIVHTAAYSNME